MQLYNACRTGPQLARLASPLQRLWNDSVDHGANAASVFSTDAAEILARLSAYFSVFTLALSATYAGWALVQFVKSRKSQKRGKSQ